MNPKDSDDRLVDQLLAAAFGAPPKRDPPAGEVPPRAALLEISSRYRIGGEIGRGGVGIVLRGRDVELNRDVAIKILRPEHRDHEGLTRRFVEEAQIGGQLEHPGIVPVHDMGRTADGRPFFAMKLVQGRTLAELLKSRRAPADEQARWLSIFEQVCQTVAYAHARGVIHRDLKPANVILGAFGEVQVADWGLAKVVGRAEPADGVAAAGTPPGSSVSAVSTARMSSSELLSQAGSVLGTLSYMPPEQARGETENVDARSDVFALGAMLCEILTGKPPYSGGAEEVLEAARGAELAPAMARLGSCGTDPELVALAKSCLAVERDERPRDASAVAEAIARHRATLQERARAAELAAAAAHARAAEERRARRLVAALAATVVLGVLLGGAVYLKNERDRRDRQDQAARPVREAVGRARELADVATRAEPGTVEPWKSALTAADGAVAAAKAGDPGPDLREAAAALHLEVSTSLARAEAAAAAAERDARTKERIGALIGKFGIWPWEEIDVAFGEAFRDWGVDFETMSQEAIVARVRASSDPIGMCDFLLAWTHVRAEVAGAGNEPVGWDSIIRVTQAVDPDPWRVRIRGAIPFDVDGLLDLLKDPQLWHVEPRTIEFLGSILSGFRHMPEAIQLFREAADHYPQEFWVQCQLASWLTEPDARRFEEALAHASAAVALDPEVATAWLTLAVARDGTGDFEGAITAFDRAFELDERSTYARPGKAISQLRSGRVDEGLATLRAELVRDPGSDDVRRALALAQLYAGDLAGSRATLLELMRSPRELDVVQRAAELLLLLREPQSAELGLRETLQRMNPKTPLTTIVIPLRYWLVAALEAQGRYDAMLDELRITDQLLRGSAANAATGIDRARLLRQLADDLPDFASGAREPASALEAVEVAKMLDRSGTTAFAAELWIDALESDPAAILACEQFARLFAARVALRAAAGDGEDAATLSLAARSRYRGEALRLLRDEVERALQTDALDPSSHERPSLEILLFDPALSSVRDPARRLMIPPDEAQQWESFFADVRTALRRVRA